jgi:hypothetical protein
MGVGDRHPAAERRVRRERGVGLGIDARDEERGHRGDPGDPLAGADPSLEAAQVRLDHLLVALHREEQRHIDRHARSGQLLDGIDAGGGRGDLDQDVGKIESPPEVERLGDRRLGIVGEVGGALEGDETVPAIGAVMHTPHDRGRAADVPERNREEELPGITDASRDQRAELGVVAVRAGDRLGEDRRIPRRSADRVLVDQRCELAALEQVPAKACQARSRPRHRAALGGGGTQPACSPPVVELGRWSSVTWSTSGVAPGGGLREKLPWSAQMRLVTQT